MSSFSKIVGYKGVPGKKQSVEVTQAQEEGMLRLLRLVAHPHKEASQSMLCDTLAITKQQAIAALQLLTNKEK